MTRTEFRDPREAGEPRSSVKCSPAPDVSATGLHMELMLAPDLGLSRSANPTGQPAHSGRRQCRLVRSRQSLAPVAPHVSVQLLDNVGWIWEP